MVYTLKKLIAYLLICSLLALFVYYVINNKSKSFNTAGNIFSNSKTSSSKRDQKEVELSDDFWTSGRFSFK